MKFCACRCKNDGKLYYSKAHRADWKWKACEIQRQKSIPVFWRILFLLLMWLYDACFGVWKLQNSKHFSLVKKSLRYLECNKSYDRLHPGTTSQNSSQNAVEAQGFVGSPTHPGCIMIYSCHQMYPALNSKPYWSNKQVVPLLGCCSDAPVSPGNRLVICGDRTIFQLSFRVELMPEIYLEKLLHFCNTSWP